MMSVRKHLVIGAVVILIFFGVAWHFTTFAMASFLTTTLLAQIIATDAFLFLYHYRKVDWKATAWGRHVMRLCLILGVTFEAVVIVNVLYAIHRYNVTVIGALSVVLYGAIAGEMHNRRYLEQRAQKIRKEHIDDAVRRRGPKAP